MHKWNECIDSGVPYEKGFLFMFLVTIPNHELNFSNESFSH